MKPKTLFLLLLLFSAILPAVPLSSEASSQVPLDMGYGPSTMFPVSGGTPVFTAGDQLWLTSHYNSTVQVSIGPAIANASRVLRSLQPGIPALALTFNASDTEEYWVLAGQGSQPPPVVFEVSDAELAPANLTIAGDSFRGGALDLNLSTALRSPFYDGQACVMGEVNASVASIPVPSQTGIGAVELTRQGPALEATGVGLGTENFTFSVGLYYSYSFLAPNSTSILVSRDVQVAVSDAVAITGGGPPVSMGVRSDGALRAGRYELRAFFEGVTGLAVATTDVLITGSGPWVWLGGCESSAVYSNAFGLVVPMNGPPSGWPRTVWLTYKVFGEQGFAEVPVGLGLAAVKFEGEPWGVILSSYNVTVVSSQGVQAIEAGNGTVYLAMPGSSASFSYLLSLGNKTFFTGNAGPLEPFTETTIPLNVSKLAVNYFVGGSPYSGGTVRVGGEGTNLTKAVTNKAGQAVFYLPPGTYQLNASGGSSSASQTVTLSERQSLQVSLGEPPSQGPVQLLVVALALLAGVGILVNVALFARARIRRGRRTRRASSAQSATSDVGRSPHSGSATMGYDT